MRPNSDEKRAGLPPCAVEYIDQVVRKMRFRKRVRAEVYEELWAHFEDDLRDVTDPQQRETRARALIEQFGDPRLVAVLCRRAKKRCRPLAQKILIRTFQGIGLFMLYLLICTLPLHLGEANVRVNYVEWLNDRWRPEQAGVENAKHYYDEAAALYVEPPKALVRKHSNWSRFVADDARQQWFPDHNDADMRLLEQWLAANDPAFQKLHIGAQTPRYWPTYETETTDLGDPNFLADAMAELPRYRMVTLAFKEHIAYQVFEGDVDRALKDCLVIWQFGRHLQGKGLLNEQLVGIAIEAVGSQSILPILQYSEVAASTLERIQRDLTKIIDSHRPVIDLDGEEVFWRDRIQRTFTDDGQGGGHALPKGIPYAAGDWTDNLLSLLVFDYPERRDAEAMVEQYFERMQCRLLLEPYENRSDKDTGLPSLSAAPNTMISLVEPAHERLGQLLWRMKTGELATLTTVAVLRYAADRGAFPETLYQLEEAGYIDEVPEDPFGQGPLSYRRTTEGFLLYSWGRNLRDDGGRMGVGSDGKPRMWSENGDWVFWPVRERDAKP